MKKIIISGVLILATLFSFADDKDFIKAMENNIKELNAAKTASDFQALANNFERIAEVKTDNWLPLYYVAYSYLNMVFSEGNEAGIDMTLDKAEAYLNKARELSPENDEIEILQGWIYQGRIQVDPMGRGQMYSEKAAVAFGKAKNINPDNPRIYFMIGQNVLYTPEMFGGGQEAACPYFREAAEKYESFEPETTISPNWGKEYNNRLYRSCEG
jgi:tetratricopeptide (TPR) repeat protein